VVGTRHDRAAPRPEAPSSGTKPRSPRARGNAAFLDCHVAFVTRREAHDPGHYDPFMRPTGGLEYNNGGGSNGSGGPGD
jgi:prepilin-type processing-associated H-X9-DG protein